MVRIMAADNPVAFCTAGALAVLGVSHTYWACGGRRGKRAVIPQRGPGPNSAPLLRPSRTATIAVALALFLAAAVTIDGAAAGNLVLALLFGLRAVGDFRWVGFSKRVRTTPFARWDTWLYSPLSLALSWGCLMSSGQF